MDRWWTSPGFLMTLMLIAAMALATAAATEAGWL